MMENTNHLSTINLAANAILKHKVEHLNVIPAVAPKLLRLSNDERTKVSDLSHLIETEPTLAAKVLRNVNSASFALPHKVTSIKRAVNILGFSAIRQLALNQLFYNKLINHQAKQEFDQLYFWQHCLFVATLSRAIAITLKHQDPDSIYTAGLLHDIGKVVLETHGKVSYSDFIIACKNDEQSTLLGEQDFFGLNHTEMGFVFCQQWDIPEQICAVVFHHHELPADDSPYACYKNDIAIISFANYIAWLQGIGSVTHNNLPTLHPEVSDYLNIDKLNLEELLNQVDIEMQNTRAFYGIPFPSLKKLRATLVETTLLLNQHNKQITNPHNLENNLSIQCLTIPHQSLEADEIVPWTLSAIQQNYNFDRLALLNINPQKRSLVTAYFWPETAASHSIQTLNSKIDLLPITLLKSLRERQAVLINRDNNVNNTILQQFNVTEFLVVPVLSHNRLIALLYFDNAIQQKPIEPDYIDQITLIARELGVALANSKRFELEKKRAELDPLTGLLNKRMMTNYLRECFQSEQDKLSQIAVGFIDIDFFKKFNDSCGHQAGDNALKIVAQILRTLTRPEDFIGRYGGEEFVFVLQGTDEQGAKSYSERIRQEIERKGKILSQRFQGYALTVSIGVSLYKTKFTNYNEIIEVADKAMYNAKNRGRNCVIIE